MAIFKVLFLFNFNAKDVCSVSCFDVHFTSFFSSPELVGSQGELIGWP